MHVDWGQVALSPGSIQCSKVKKTERALEEGGGGCELYRPGINNLTLDGGCACSAGELHVTHVCTTSKEFPDRLVIITYSLLTSGALPKHFRQTRFRWGDNMVVQYYVQSHESGRYLFGRTEP